MSTIKGILYKYVQITEVIIKPKLSLKYSVFREFQFTECLVWYLVYNIIYWKVNYNMSWTQLKNIKKDCFPIKSGFFILLYVCRKKIFCYIFIL